MWTGQQDEMNNKLTVKKGTRIVSGLCPFCGILVSREFSPFKDGSQVFTEAVTDHIKTTHGPKERRAWKSAVDADEAVIEKGEV